MKEIIPLTETQQDLVTKNHNLIYSFAKRYNLDLEDYYDILAISLCKAVASYDGSKGAFSTLAYKVMTNDVLSFKRSQSLLKRCVNDNTLEYSDDIKNNFLDNSQLSLETSAELSMLSDLEKDILNDKCNGLTVQEIADKENVTTTIVGRCFEKIKCILRGENY